MIKSLQKCQCDLHYQRIGRSLQLLSLADRLEVGNERVLVPYSAEAASSAAPNAIGAYRKVLAPVMNADVRGGCPSPLT
jgi:hypothetical protein